MNLDQMQVIVMLLAFIGGVLSIIGGYIANRFGHMANSVDLLNIKLAVVIEKLEYHERRLSKLEGDH